MPKSLAEVIAREIERRGAAARALSPEQVAKLGQIAAELRELHAELVGDAAAETTTAGPEAPTAGLAVKAIQTASPVLTSLIGGGAGMALPGLVKLATGYDLKLTPEEAGTICMMAAGGTHGILKGGRALIGKMLKR